VRVVRELSALVAKRGKPEMIVSDNGRELMLRWMHELRIEW
jgi:putative transposase